MSLPTVDPKNYEGRNGPMSARERGIEVSQATGAITAAGLVNGVRYTTGEKRAIRLRVAGEMLGRQVESFNELSDAELRGVVATCIRCKHTVAEWLRGQDLGGTPING